MENENGFRNVFRWAMLQYILSRDSKAGSQTNRLGSGQRRDTDQEPFSPSKAQGVRKTLSKCIPTLDLFY